MKNERNTTFQANIRRIFILEAIIPVFCIAGICLFLFLLFSHYTVQKSNDASNRKIAYTLEETITKYSDAIETLAHDEEIDWGHMDIDQLVAIRRTMYQLTKGTGYSAQLYILDADLQPITSDISKDDTFLTNHVYKDSGIIYEIDQASGQISMRLTSGENQLLCIGTDISNEDRRTGYLLVTIDSSEFELLLTEVPAQTIVADSRGWIYFANNYVFQDNLGRFVSSLKEAKGNVEYNQHYYYLSRREIVNQNLVVYTITDNDMRMKMNQVLSVSIVLMFFMIVGITYVISKKVAQKSTADINEMAKAFEQVKKGNLERHLDISSSIEFQEIGEAYNMMLDGLKRQIAENKELAEHAAFAQVKQLEAQFNPHFLFNTLDNIRFMSKIDSEKADQMIVALSNLLRYSISTAEEEITVKEELKFTQSYLDILKIRFNRRLTYEVNVAEEAMECLIPKLMIQPLIENAVKYGYAGQEHLTVVVQGGISEQQLIFQCIDDGSGIEADMLEEIRGNLSSNVNKSGHYGLFNIHRRIRLMYGDKYGITIESKKQEGTTLTLTLPIHIKEGEGTDPC